MDLTLALAITSTLISIVAVWAALRIAINSTSIPAELQVFTEFRSAEARAARGVVIHLHNRETLKDGGFDAQPREISDAIRNVAHFYDHVGLLMESGFIRRKTFADYLAISPRQCWWSLRSIVDSEREHRGDPAFLKHFERLGTQKLNPDRQRAFDSWLERIGASSA